MVAEGRRLLSSGSSGLVIRDTHRRVLRRCRGRSARSRGGPRRPPDCVPRFACDDPNERGGPLCADLWVVRSDGTARRLVKANVDVTQEIDGRYAWAPDGRRLVYAAFDPNALMIVNVADGAKRILRGTRRVGAGQPSWSPDGRLIAFLRQRAPFGGSDIYVVHRTEPVCAAGSDPRRPGDAEVVARRPQHRLLPPHRRHAWRGSGRSWSRTQTAGGRAGSA